MNDSRILYLDIARIVAVGSMVMLHVAAQKWHLLVTSSEWQACNVYDSIVRFCVPLFVMISGALFLDPDKNVSLKRLYGKNIFRIVTAFVFWSVAYAVLITHRSILSEVISGSGIRSLTGTIVVGHVHLWFLYMIVGLYMVVPFLKKIAADKKLTEYFLLLAFVFTFIIPCLHAIPALAGTLEVILEKKLHFHFVLGYSFYFVGGFYLHRYGLSLWKKYGVYLLGMIGVLLTIFMTNYLSVRVGEGVGWFYGYLRPHTAMTTIAIFIFFRDNVSRISFGEKTVGHILTVSKYSFGIYLVHMFFIFYVIHKIDYVVAPHIHPVITIPLYTLIVLICSYIASAVLNRIPVLNRYIV